MEMKASAILLRHSSVDRTFITVEYEIKLNEFLRKINPKYESRVWMASPLKVTL